MPNITKPSDINKVWSNAGDNLSPSDAKINGGWLTEIPPRQWFNWLDNKQDQAIAHINQHGIAVWDATTEYQANGSLVQGSNGKIYAAFVTNTNQNPVTDVTETYWADVFKPGVAVFPTAGGTVWPVPTVLKLGLKRAQVMVIGGGGGGGQNANAGGGGGGGGIAYKNVDLTGVATVTVTVGAGGGNSVNGSSSSFGAFCSATGGTAATGSSGQDHGNGGIGVGGDINDTHGPGYQRAASPVAGEKISGKGGGSGGGGSIESGTVVGQDAVGFGCGGGGGTGGAAGGAGKQGLVVVRW